MASSSVKLNKHVRRMETKKSHSWWWDSHISPRNSKWLAENLEEMDQSVKRMLKLIEDDGDSFARKAEMYYQKRPELINHVEEFYRMHRSLAERYDHVTGELRKTIPSDLQSQGSGFSDVGSESSAASLPDNRLSRRKSGHRAAGFEFFLGNAGSGSDLCNKDGDESSTLDSESEIDDSSVVNYSGSAGDIVDQELQKRIVELEAELSQVKDKLLQQKDNSDKSSQRDKSYDVLLAKIAGYEEELRVAREENMHSEQEMAMLKAELQKQKSLVLTNEMTTGLNSSQKDLKTLGLGRETVEKDAGKLGEGVTNGLEGHISYPESTIQPFAKTLKITQEKLQNSEKEVINLRYELDSKKSSTQHLQDQLGSSQKEVNAWKNKLDKEKREVSKLHDRIARYKSNLSDRDQEIRGLKEAISNADKSLSEENSQLQAEITKLLKERTYLEDNIKEWDFRCQTLEEDVRRIKAQKKDIENVLEGEIRQLKADIAQRDDLMKDLNKKIDEIKLKHDLLLVQRDELSTKVATLILEMNYKDDHSEHLDNQLYQLHADLATKTEKAENQMNELKREVERLQELIQKGSEEKREAIRQLCFSIEHYRDGYHQLRQAFVGH